MVCSRRSRANCPASSTKPSNCRRRNRRCPLTGKFTVGKQRLLVTEILRAFGFPFDRGRLDESEHPFTEGVPGDIRITARFDASDPFSGVLGVLHESGHAMYDLGLPKDWLDQPVGRDRGMALEESQSLLLEMIIGRSRAFVRYLKPMLEKHLGVSGPEWSEENLYAHLNRVRRSLIRVDADELTYPLHVMLRYDLEKRILAGGAAGARYSGSLECIHGRAPRHPAAERCRGMSAGHSLGSGVVRLLSLVCARRNHRRASSGTACGRNAPRLDEEIASGRVRRFVRMAARECARRRGEGVGAGTAEKCDGQAADGGSIAALSGIEMHGERDMRHQRPLPSRN